MYSSEKNVQILIALLKAHGIRKIIISPGSANLSFVGSVQDDEFFELYSCVDERSAGYMACGLAEESGEAVVISCTGATASRNYLPALTEAYYRKIPILAITSTRRLSMIGQNVDQVIDRTQIQHDVAKLSVTLPVVDNEEDEWECNLKVNNAILELNHNGKGPVHINLVTSYSANFSVKKLIDTRCIRRHDCCDNINISPKQNVGIFVGSHSKWDDDFIKVVDEFCEKYNSFVFCDQTSNYKGKYGIYVGLLNLQNRMSADPLNLDILIHIGNVSATWPSNTKEIWRINPDGCIRDTYRKLSKVFEMEEIKFFRYMNAKRESFDISSFTNARDLYNAAHNLLLENINKVPFSSLWIAASSYALFPEDSTVHFGILNSLRCWNCFDLGMNCTGYSNVGGFGIDGGVSSLIGASWVNPEKIYYGILGDLAFFYDMNSIGNRHIGKNLRIMVVNNGLGVEFKRGDINVQKAGLGDKANPFVSAEGHFGRKSTSLLKHYAQDLGFDYISATTKDSFEKNIGKFFGIDCFSSIIFEVFIDEHDDSKALDFLKDLHQDNRYSSAAIDTSKRLVKSFLGEKNISTLKTWIKS